MFATDIASATKGWQPQLFGTRRAQQIQDPLIEPVWEGPRVLALIDDGTVSVTDISADRVEISASLDEAIRASAASPSLVIEACLTEQPFWEAAERAARGVPDTSAAAQPIAQMLLGDRVAQAKRRIEIPQELPGSAIDAAESDVVVVALDLLWLDGEPLSGVPLLERKRVLESVIIPSELVRIGIYVRPPVDKWMASWRSSRFRRIAYKGANSRYLPGERNADWAIARIPTR